MESEIQIDGVLKNATYYPSVSGKRVNGDLYGDRKGRFADGTNVTTSTILSGPDEQGVIHTRNSVYRVEFAPGGDDLSKAGGE